MKKNSYQLFFRCLGAPTRMAIVESLIKGPKAVSAICSATGFEQSRASHALTQLSAMGLVSWSREGKFRIYELDERVALAVAEIESFMRVHEGRLCKCGILKGGKACRHIGDKNGKAKNNKD